jgi:hypothetical protein
MQSTGVAIAIEEMQEENKRAKDQLLEILRQDRSHFEAKLNVELKKLESKVMGNIEGIQQSLFQIMNETINLPVSSHRGSTDSKDIASLYYEVSRLKRQMDEVTVPLIESASFMPPRTANQASRPRRNIIKPTLSLSHRGFDKANNHLSSTITMGRTLNIHK